jgi:hypothetical protein
MPRRKWHRSARSTTSAARSPPSDRRATRSSPPRGRRPRVPKLTTLHRLALRPMTAAGPRPAREAQAPAAGLGVATAPPRPGDVPARPGCGARGRPRSGRPGAPVQVAIGSTPSVDLRWSPGRVVVTVDLAPRGGALPNARVSAAIRCRPGRRPVADHRPRGDLLGAAEDAARGRRASMSTGELGCAWRSAPPRALGEVAWPRAASSASAPLARRRRGSLLWRSSPSSIAARSRPAWPSATARA